ncbi:MAG: hypothetical protein AVDCRST_MAG93-9337 [uncultured Chloroflexia bacterium]|uniref:Uncharacterized protein n=1 Tax=uncultured Chloroflexia bacterium TaxID=1672391 RepID=A0A6J4NEC9_9CHLR|nr:MAG: hypothetical protein AVDCRST_MAG93-9337 [uncultured Chloroflexia bacterium]
MQLLNMFRGKVLHAILRREPLGIRARLKEQSILKVRGRPT